VLAEAAVPWLVEVGSYPKRPAIESPVGFIVLMSGPIDRRGRLEMLFTAD